MAYRFERDEPIPMGVRRIVGEQAKHALTQLRVGEREHREGIHEARKSFKKIRGVLRLLRFELDGSYRRENESYRNLGLLLAQARDADALIESLEKLEALPDEMIGPELLVPLRRFLVMRRDFIIGEDLDLRKRLMTVASELHIAQGRLDAWPLDRDGIDAVEAGFAKSYRQARGRLAGVVEAPDDHTYHELRKGSKNLWYHARLFSNYWNGAADEYRADLDRLNDLLGDHHDLAVLKEVLRKEAPAFLRKCQICCLNDALRERQAQLEAEAVPLGKRLLARKPKKMVAALRHAFETPRVDPVEEPESGGEGTADPVAGPKIRRPGRLTDRAASGATDRI